MLDPPVKAIDVFSVQYRYWGGAPVAHFTKFDENYICFRKHIFIATLVADYKDIVILENQLFLRLDNPYGKKLKNLKQKQKNNNQELNPRWVSISKRG